MVNKRRCERTKEYRKILTIVARAFPGVVAASLANRTEQGIQSAKSRPVRLR